MTETAENNLPKKIEPINNFVRFNPGIFGNDNMSKIAEIINKLITKSNEQTKAINKLIDLNKNKITCK